MLRGFLVISEQQTDISSSDVQAILVITEQHTDISSNHV